MRSALRIGSSKSTPPRKFSFGVLEASVTAKSELASTPLKTQSAAVNRDHSGCQASGSGSAAEEGAGERSSQVKRQTTPIARKRSAQRRLRRGDGRSGFAVPGTVARACTPHPIIDQQAAQVCYLVLGTEMRCSPL